MEMVIPFCVQFYEEIETSEESDGTYTVQESGLVDSDD
jgi:hypothetical protein